MSVNIVWSTSSDYVADVVTEPVLYSLSTGVSAQTAYSKLFITNVGDEDALNCRFYVAPVDITGNPSSLSDFTTAMSWSVDSQNGLFTITGAANVAAFDADFAAPPSTYYNSLLQHTYLQGINPENGIVLQSGDGLQNDQINPITDDGTTQEINVVVRIPIAEPANTIQFTHILYYEELV